MPSTHNAHVRQKSLRLSIPPTYDIRKTGPRFEVASFVSDRLISREKIVDPFVRHTVRVSVIDALLSLIRSGCVKVEVNVNGDNAIMEDVLELNADYIGWDNTRRAEWNASLESALAEHGEK